MKKVFLLLVAVVFTVHAFSQNEGKKSKTPEEMAQKRAEKLKTQLELSDEQTVSVQGFILEKIQNKQAIKSKYKDSANRKGMNKELKIVKTNFDSKMEGILTAAQKVKYADLKAENKNKGKSKGKRRGKGKKEKSKSGDSDDEDENED
ncbi:MAG: hypothetical protein R2852_00195 [Bacteroidia bacterium]